MGYWGRLVDLFRTRQVEICFNVEQLQTSLNNLNIQLQTQ